MKHATRTTLVLLSTVLLLAAGLAAQKPDSAQALLRAATDKAVVDGDLNGAIKQYQTIVDKFRTDRAVVATALVHMAECYQKLGDAESRKIYERVMREFTDQPESVATARTQLAALRGPSTGPTTMTTRRVWSPEPGSVSGMGSTDGHYLSYGDRTGNLVVHSLATGETRRFINKGPFDPAINTEADYSVISPDGRQIAYAFWNGHYDLRVVPVSAATSGAPPRILFSNEDVDFPDPADWSPDGKQILVVLERKDKTNQLALISAADGSLRVLKSLDWRWPEGRFSPDGRYIAYDIQVTQGLPDHKIVVLATDGSREITLVESPGTGGVLGWAPDGKRILFASNRTGSWGAWSIEVAEGRPQGSPELVKGDIGGITPIGSTRSGALYYQLPTGMQDIYIASLDMATGKVTVPPAPVNARRLGGKQNGAWSPDGQYLAYLSGGLHIRSMKTDEERELSLSPNLRFGGQTRFGRLHWSPDGRSLLTKGADDKQHQGIYTIDVQTGAVASIVQEEQGQGEPAYGVWSADGKAIFYALNRSNFFGATGSQLAKEAIQEDKIGIRVRDLETGRDTEIYRPALLDQINHLALSPDGRWLGFVSNRRVETAGKPTKVEEDLLVMPATGGDPRELLKVQGVTEFNALAVLEWTRDGEHLLYSWNRELWKISAKGGQAQKLGLASTAARQSSLSVHPDGHRIAFTAGEPKEEVWVMENFWPAATTRR